MGNLLDLFSRNSALTFQALSFEIIFVPMGSG